MFDKLEERINEFMESNEGGRIFFRFYIKYQNSALILSIETPPMQRLHLKVIDQLIFHKKLNKIQPRKYLPKCIEKKTEVQISPTFSYSYKKGSVYSLNFGK